jgi:CBS domain-containing protein
LLREKGDQVYTVQPNDTVLTALQLMDEKNIGAVLVMDGEEVAGIFSERDYARRGDLLNQKAADTPVLTMMTRLVYYIRPDQSIEECMALMTGRRIRHLPVLEDGRLVGIISIGDVVKTVISEQAFTIEQLEQYIMWPR